MCANRCRNFRSQKCAQERKREDSKIRRSYNRNTEHVEYKSISDTSNNRGDWNHLKLFRKYLSNIPARHGIKELQKTAILGTAHILRSSSTKHSTL